jgi:uncharacterized protein YdiU (UPF0061 family)
MSAALDSLSSGSASRFAFDNSFVRDLEGLFEPWRAATVPGPSLLALNAGLANELGLDPAWLASPAGVAVLCGNDTPDGAASVAQAYAGHQFGNYSPRLGDGRALLLGEVTDTNGKRRDIHLKGSGRTPFARGGDGKAAVGPMLREYVIGEAMHALGIPTTRALAVVATGEQIVRETPLPGAVLTRVAASHLRVGMFQYAAANGGPDLVQRLADHAIARHYPHLVELPAESSVDVIHNRYLAFYEAVLDAQARLIAKWMSVGFIHGVMNTDNMTISGETIDFGPCAFMDAFDPATVYSSIDHAGRYAYGNQPVVAQWNLARLAETLLPLIDSDKDASVEKATTVLQTFPERYGSHWTREIHAKIGLAEHTTDDATLIDDLFAVLQTQRVDLTLFFRALGAAALDDHAAIHSLVHDTAAFDSWATRWKQQLDAQEAVHPHLDRAMVAATMNVTNPLYVPRNHKVEEALTAAVDGDLGPFTTLVDLVSNPYTEQPGRDDYASPAPDSFGPYRTFCGT